MRANQRRKNRFARQHNRRGVILMMVLVVLSFFVMVGITFVLQATHSRLAAKVNAAIEQTTDPPASLLNRVAMQVIRGSNNSRSVLWRHSLLEDMYGNESVLGQIPSVATNGFNGFVALNSNYCLAGGVMMYLEVDLNGSGYNTFPGYYNGRVITMIDGVAANKSSRITGYQVNIPGDDFAPADFSPPLQEGRGRLRIIPFDGMALDPGTNGFRAQGSPVPNNRFLINGAPFNGAGFGYDRQVGPNYATTNAQNFAGQQFALLPNASLADPLYAAHLTTSNLHPDEDYDAVDYQNMILAAKVWQALPGGGALAWYVPIPSLHRPDLINYWINQTGAGTWAGLPPNLKRQISLRPIADDHFYDQNGNNTYDAGEPDFAGRINFDPIFGAWDVDNDGDGFTDSIWVDFGAQVQTMPDGRRMKPLAAIMVLDQDGKININAHGHRGWAAGGPLGEYYKTLQTLPVMGDAPFAQGITTPQLQAGSGYTVGGINTGPIFMPPYTGVSGLMNEMRNVEVGMPPIAGNPPVPGRDGETHLLIAGTMPGPGTTRSIASLDPGFDPLGFDDLYGGDDNWPPSDVPFVSGIDPRAYGGNMYYYGYYPSMFAGIGRRAGIYGTPPDLDDHGVLALDFRGQPFYYNHPYDGTLTTPLPGAIPEAIDDPSERDLSDRGQRTTNYYGPDAVPGTTDDLPFLTDLKDANYTPFELEYIARLRDVDGAELPSRLGNLAPATLNNPLRSNLLTTHSFDVPVASVQPTPEMRLGANGIPGDTDDPPASPRLIDLFALRLFQGPSTLPPNQLNRELEKMISHELMSGLRMDINRALGNGWDDNGNGVVDEIVEANLERYLGNTGAAITQISTLPPGMPLPGGTSTPMDLNNDGNNGAAFNNINDTTIRYEIAKQIYLLLMLVKDRDYAIHLDPLEGPALSSIAAGSPTPTAAEREYTARRLAQYAINAVDFRDADMICTPFEYDADPFGNNSGIAGWNVDGWIGKNPGPDGAFGSGDDNPGADGIPGTADDDAAIGFSDDPSMAGSNPHPDRRVVWGAEEPCLLLTETVATHDRRVLDSATDDGPAQRRDQDNDGNSDDLTLDQGRVPQGSLFVELMCTRNPNNPVASGELYNFNTPGIPQLDLGRMSPAAPTFAGLPLPPGPRYPVWRIAISDNHYGNPADFNNIQARLQQNPDTCAVEPDRMSLVNDVLGVGDPAVQPVVIDRIIWLGETPPTPATPDINRIYFNRNPVGTTLLGPGDYAVIGPRPMTKIGYTDPTNATLALPQKIQLDPLAGVNISDNNGGSILLGPGSSYPYPTVGTHIRQPLGIVCAADKVGFPFPVGISISEPLYSSANYYPAPTGPIVTDPRDGEVQNDWYGQEANAMAPFRDQPLDSVAGGAGNQTLADYNLVRTGTYTNARSIMLQRLANPLLPWNPDPRRFDGTPEPNYNPSYPVNPYITVDYMPVDLTVFNGQDYNPPLAGTMLVPFDTDDPNPDSAPTQIRFATRQRGSEPGSLRTPDPTMGGSNYNLWRFDFGTADTTLPPDPTAPSEDFTNPNIGVTYPFRHLLDHTLGFINRPWMDMSGGSRWIFNGDPLVPPAFGAQYIGSPRRPFPWLTWNDRPYVSANEMLLVPASSPARLGMEFEWRGPTSRDQFADLHTPIGDDPPFRHLLNFFQSYNPNAPTQPAGNFYRLLELVRVPSRFSGGDEWMGSPVLNSTNAAPHVHDLHPPYNKVSNFREPGRINVNTMFDDGRTLQAVLNQMQEATILAPGVSVPVDETWGGNPITTGAQLGPADSLYVSGGSLWDKFVRSRRGYAAGGSTIFTLNPNSPTVFANPFRGFLSNYNVPNVPALNELPGSPGTLRRHVESGFFRIDPDDSFRPLFARNSTADTLAHPLNTLQDTDNSRTEADLLNTNKNPYFRYEAFQRLGNLVTTRSNVYAVWVTVGYFEVQQVPADPVVYPDGYRIVREIGSDAGHVKRHRGFFLIDRTIPVGFQRGENLNTDKTIMVERYIE